MIRPSRGMKIFSSAENNKYPTKTLIGYVKDVDDDICHYRRLDGISDSFIWKFKDGINKNVTVEA